MFLQTSLWFILSSCVLHAFAQLNLLGLITDNDYFKYAAAGVVPKMNLIEPFKTTVITVRATCMRLNNLDPKVLGEYESGVNRTPTEKLARVIECTNGKVDLFVDNNQLNELVFKLLVKKSIRAEMKTCLKNQEPGEFSRVMDFYECFVKIIMKDE